MFATNQRHSDKTEPDAFNLKTVIICCAEQYDEQNKISLNQWKLRAGAEYA